MTLNWWAILVAAVVQWLIGWIWYGPLFGKQWMAMMGYTKENMNNQPGMLSPAKAMALGLVSAIIMSIVVGVAFLYLPLPSIWCGALTGGIIWLGFIATTMINSVIFEGKKFKLFALNSGYYLVALMVMGAIVAAWR